MAFMLPTQKTLNIDEIDGRLSGFAKMPRAVQISLSKPLSGDGYGRVTIDGIQLSRGETVTAGKFTLLLIPAGEVAREYGKKYKVRLEGFKAVDGSRFSPCSFTLRTDDKRVQDPRYALEDQKALDAACEGMVLLKNEGDLLPLPPDSPLACFGAAQYMFRVTATGASCINPRWQPTFLDAIQDHSDFRLDMETSSLYAACQNIVPTKAQLDLARSKSDTTLIFLSRSSGEGMDNRPEPGEYYLTCGEEDMIAAVRAVFDKVIVILNTGYPISMEWVRRYDIPTVLWTGFAGMLASYALVEILDGRTNPSGHLACTWLWDYYDHPVSRNFPTPAAGEKTPVETEQGVHIFYEEDIYMGYRWFDTFRKPTAFSFGHGLSYTKFRISTDVLRQTDHGVALTVSVTNTGIHSGKEVVQVYVSAPDGRLEKPAHVLCAFAKTRLLAPNECESLTLSAPFSAFASYSEDDSAYLLEQGRYEFSVGDSLSALMPAGELTLEHDLILRRTQNLGKPVEKFRRLTKNDPTVDGTKSGFCSPEERITAHAQRCEYRPAPLAGYSGKRITWDALLADSGLLDDFVSQMTTDELCALNINAGPHWFFPWDDGSAGSVAKLKKYHIPPARVSDANAGLHLNKPNIGFPQSSVIASTFNRSIARMVGNVIADESIENGMVINLGPGMNLQRNLLNGRHAEYFSEDPLLAGVMAGSQGKGIEERGVGCCYKHLFCNNSDTCRKASHSIVSERALRELYFRTFEIAMDIQVPSCLMTSYNALNGIYPAESAELLQGLVRDEWDFNGMILTDWDSYDTIDMIEMVKAGTSWVSSGGSKQVKALRKAARTGVVSRAVLESNVKWLMKILLKLHSAKTCR